jgi:hypothetical protein
MKFAAWYGIVVGLLILGMWSFFLVSDQVPELETEPFRISFHLAAEFTTAISLVTGGIGLIRNLSHARNVYFVATGMLLYSLIVSPGYYAQKGQWAFVVMFTLLIVLTLISVAKVVRIKEG